MTTGNEAGDPACGTVTVRESGQNASTVAGVNVDMAAVQTSVLSNVLTGTVRPGVASIAQQLWQTKNSAALAGLQGVYTQGVNSYTQGLTAAASSLQQSINSALLSNAGQARNGGLDLAAGATQQSTLGWTSAGAYYLEIARANAATLSLLTSVPVTTSPTYDGLPPSLASDLAPFGQQITSFMSTLQQVVNSQDGINHPSGSPATLAMAQQNSYEPLSFLGRLFQAMTLDGASLQKITAVFSGTNVSNWTNPFGALMSMGQMLIITSLIALGTTALLQSATGGFFAAVVRFNNLLDTSKQAERVLAIRDQEITDLKQRLADAEATTRNVRAQWASLADVQKRYLGRALDAEAELRALRSQQP